MEDARVEFNSFEPSLDEVLAEPIVRRLMRRDGVTEESVRQLTRRAATARRQPGLPSTMPLADTGGKVPPLASLGVLAQATAPLWPRVFLISNGLMSEQQT